MGWKLISRDVVKEMLVRDIPARVIDALIDDNDLLINSNKTASVSMVSKQVLAVFDKIKSAGVQPLFIGCRVCDTQDQAKGRLNLQFATKASCLGVPRAVLNHKAEQLFLYSRDVLSSSILGLEGRVSRKRLVFVFNKDDLFLGLAFALSNDPSKKGKQMVLKNVIDTGSYLRIEKPKKRLKHPTDS
jgi:ribosome biogenesis protein Nip4